MKTRRPSYSDKPIKAWKSLDLYGKLCVCFDIKHVWCYWCWNLSGRLNFLCPPHALRTLVKLIGILFALLQIILMNEINDIFGNGFHTSLWHIPNWVAGLLLWFAQEFYGNPLASMLRFHKLGIGHKLLGIWVFVEINDLEVFEWSSLTHLLSLILRPVNNSWI